MLKKLSRILGVTGSVLAMLPYLLTIAYCLRVIITSNNQNNIAGDISGEGTGLAYVLVFIYIAPVLLSFSGIIGSFYVRRRPVAAGIVMALSGMLGLLYAFGYYFSSPFPAPPEIAVPAKILAAALLFAAGVLAVISRRESPEDAQRGKSEWGRLPLIRQISFIIAVICAGLHMLPWAILSVFALFNNPPMFLFYASPLLVSAMGLWGSLVILKRPVVGAIIMFLSGVPLYLMVHLHSFNIPWWLGIPPFLLVAAGVFAVISFFVSRRKTPEQPQSVKPERTSRRPSAVRTSSRIVAVICASLNMLPWVYFSIYALCSAPHVFLPYWSFPLVISAIGLWGSLLLRNKPLAGAIMMLLSGAPVFFIALLYTSMIPYWWLSVPPFLLVAAGIFGIVAGKITAGKESRSEG